MRQAFVLQLGSQTDAAQCQFEGCIEEVDTGRELRFKSTNELLEFLCESFEEAVRSGFEPDVACEGKARRPVDYWTPTQRFE